MGKPFSSTVSPTVTAGAYSAADVVGGLLTFSGVPKRGKITEVVVTDQAKQAGALDLVLFNTEPTTIADNGASDIADADIAKIATAIRLADTAGAHKYDFSDNKIYVIAELNRRFERTGDALYGFLIAAGTPTFAAVTDVSITIKGEADVP